MDLEAAIEARVGERMRVAERYPDAEMVGFFSASTYLIRLDGQPYLVSLETLELIPQSTTTVETLDPDSLSGL